MYTEIRVALVYQQEEGSQALRAALANAGVQVDLLCRASELVTSGILQSQVDAIVVNLDPELEDLLDQVTDALDAAQRPVIYNDPAASSDLSGWDRARWLRHLSAKMKGQSNVTPPAPPGAQAIPTPAARVAPKAAEIPQADEFVMLAASAATTPVDISPTAPAGHADVMMDLGVGDLDMMFEEPSAAPTAPEPLATTREMPALTDFDLMFEEPVVAPDEPRQDTPAAQAGAPEATFDDFDMMFEALPSVRPEPAAAEPPAAPASAGLTVGDDLGDLDALFDSVTVDDAAATPPPSPSTLSSTELELEALFAEAPAESSLPAPTPVATGAELTDLDALFREFEASQTAPAPVAREPVNKATAKVAESKAPPLSWSLEPVEEVAPKAKAQSDKLITEWRLDAPSKPITPAAPAAAPTVTAKPPSGPSIPADLEASLALADFKLLDDTDDASNAPKGTAADLDRLDLSSIDLDPGAAPQSNLSIESGDELGLDNLDFDLELGTEELGRMHAASDGGHDKGGLSDLDSLFEPVPETATLAMSLADLSRVFVLGASIGGPEAIKAFLARLPAATPAAFIVAQHMGGEFLQMMATQLNAATPLSVRLAKAGERLRHGEVVVAPAADQLSVDERGYLQLNAAPSGSPYSPSIDHLAREVSNRFGDHATLILFSGMGTDAVEGGRYLTARGGQVWAQERSSCVITSMIDSAKSQGLIRFEGTPAQLAERVLQVVS